MSGSCCRSQPVSGIEDEDDDEDEDDFLLRPTNTGSPWGVSKVA